MEKQLKQLLTAINLMLLIFAGCTAEENKQETKIEKENKAENAPSKPAQPDSTFTGKKIEYYKGGEKKMEGMMRNGKREGEWKSYYSTGALWSQGFYENGKQYGKSISFYENGKQQFEGFYKDGNPIGHWTFWDENGKVKKEIDYKKEEK